MDKITVVCPHCGKTNAIPPKEHYSKAACGHCKGSLLDTHPIALNTTTWDHFLANNDLPIVVDFWAPWCGPCKMMAPTFERVSAQFPLKVRFAKVNTEEEQHLAARYGIRSIPTLILFHQGKPIDQVSGALDATALSRWITQTRTAQ